VEIAERDDLAATTVAGPRAETVLAVELPRERWSHTASILDGVAVDVVREGRLGVAGFTCWASRGDGPRLETALAGHPDVTRVGFDALDEARIVAGIGRCSQDFGHENFPQETGAEADGVSYSKGCYLGQEVVARIHYRGGVQRALRGLRFPGGAPPVGTAVLASDGREAGVVTSTIVTPAHGAIGLAVLHQRVGEAGASVALANGGGAELTPLPFVTAAS
jgi:folate-binding protein YgfZ